MNFRAWRWLGILAMAFAFRWSAAAVEAIPGKVAGADGKPVAGARVFVCGQAAAAPRTFKVLAEGRSGADGAFRISLPEADREGLEYYIIHAHKDGLSWGQGYFSPERKADVNVVLDKPASVSGRVSDQKGAPIAGARVYVFAAKGSGGTYGSVSSLTGLSGPGSLSAETDKSGAFVINDLPDGATCRFRAEAAGYATFSDMSRGDRGVSAPAQGVAIALGPESRVRGTLKQEKGGAPVAGIPLLFAVANDRVFTATDAEGRFDARGLAAGDCRVAVETQGKDLGGVLAATPPLHLNEGETLDNVTLLWTEGAILQGKVLNEKTKEPVAGASVNLGHPNPEENRTGGVWQRTDNSGAFRLRALPGNYAVQIYKENYAQLAGRQVALAGGAQTQDFAIQPVMLTKLTVVDETGKPLAKAVIHRFSQALATTDDKGQAQINLRPASGMMFDRVLVMSDSGDRAALLQSAAGDAQEMTVTLGKTATLTGLVKKPDGSPLAGAAAQAYWRMANSAGPEGAPVRADAEGRYRISGMIPGVTYAVQATAKGYGTNGYMNMKSATPEGGAEVEMEPITLETATAVLSGRVTDPSGAPIPNVEIGLYGQKNDRKSATTDKDGRFKIEELVPEELWINGRMPEARRGLFNRRVAPAEFANLDIVVYPELDPNQKMASNAPAPALKELDWVQGAWIGFAGKRTAVAFVSIKNRASRAVIKELQAAVEAAKDGSPAAVLVHDATATAEEIADFLAKNKITLPVGRVKVEADSGWFAPAFHAYKVSGIPTVIIVNARGSVEAANVKPSELPAKLAGGTK